MQKYLEEAGVGFQVIRNIFPQVPTAAGPYFRIPIRGMVLIPIYGAFRTASVSDKYKVVTRPEKRQSGDRRDCKLSGFQLADELDD